jgi:molybdopterin converting factor small subunit
LHAERKADDTLADRQKIETDLRSTIEDLERRCEMLSGELAATASQNKLLTDANNKSQAEWRSMTVELDESRTTVGRLHDDLQKHEKITAADHDEIRTRHANATSVMESQLRVRFFLRRQNFKTYSF